MAEPDKQQIGDGSDNYGQAVGQMIKAARQAGQEAAKQTAMKGIEATANAAAATVQASVEGGKAAAEIAAGTAAGGPWGAILSAAWAMRHTLFKILVCICLALLFLIVMIVSLPSIVANSIFGLDGTQPVEGATLQGTYSELSGVVSDVIDGGYDLSLAKVEQIIEEGGYDYELSMDAMVNYAQSSAGFDVSYILAAYSASLQQQGVSEDDMVAKLESVADRMFPVTYEEKEQERLIPVTYSTYRQVMVTVVTNRVQTGTINGVPQYRYSTARRSYYLPDGTESSETEVTVTAYSEVTVDVPVYSGGTITGTRQETYYTADGEETLYPTTEIIKYVECTIHPFDNTVIASAFGIDMNATYPQFNVTYGEAIQNMANALKMTLYGSLGSGQMVPLTDAELIAFVNRQECSAMRKHILTTALSLVGKVPYFWGGKSGPGWNDEWNTPKLVTAAGSSSTGTIRPYGLDCSGFSTWVFTTAVGVNIGAGCNGQYPNTYGISASELLPGDLGFLADDDGWGHVLIFAGCGENGERMWVHSSGGTGVILNTPSYEGSLSYRRLSIVDYDAPVSDNSAYGEPLYTLTVDVTHYCACAKCCGSNADGITASGKQAAPGMVAMSSTYPFGTLIEINGVMYTVEDRGGSGIENNPSSEEQFSIISSFASWLKISPMKLQFKSITRKADSDRHVAMIRQELEMEESEQCRHLGEGYIRLIRDVGSREALTRRFFLIFQYEELRRGDSDDLSQVYGTLQAAEQNARAYFMQCGNLIVQLRDPDEATAEILYMFFNRRSCVDEPFSSRVNRVVVDTMAAKNKIIGIDPVPHIRMAHFLSPRGIDLTHYNYIVMDGLYYCFLSIKGNGYPGMVRAGWMSALINAGEGIDIDVQLRRENRSRTIDKVAQRIRLNRTKLRSMQDTSTDYEELTNSIQAGYFIKQGIANNNEDLFYLSVFVTISGRSYDELMWRKQQMTDMLKSMDMYISDCRFQQEAALRSVMPFLQMDPSLEKKSRRNVLTSGAASTYLFTSFEMSDDTGVLLGVNRHNNSLCIVDLFNTKKNKNANLNLLGTSGAGKTFTMQLLALRMRMRGIQCFILAPIKGHEFRRACKKIGGEFIKIAPGSPHCINIMEIRHTISPEMELIDELDYSEMDSMLARKIQQLMTFFSLLIPDMTNEEEQMLDEALISTYAKFGITHDNDSLYEDRSCSPPKMKKMPIIGDLHKELQENPLTKRIAIIISRFVTGSAQSFNQQTNVDLHNKYIVLDLSELKGKLLPVGMFIALDYVWDTVKADRTKKKAIMIDEIWQLIGASSNRMAAEFCLTIFKTIRGFGGAAVSATQDLSDFFGLEDGKYGRAIINNSKNKIILNLEPDEAKYVQEVLKLTKTEIRSVTRFERGEALVCSNSNKVPVVIKASKEEQEMITTDRAELEAILKERQQKQTHLS